MQRSSLFRKRRAMMMQADETVGITAWHAAQERPRPILGLRPTGGMQPSGGMQTSGDMQPSCCLMAEDGPMADAAWPRGGLMADAARPLAVA